MRFLWTAVVAVIGLLPALPVHAELEGWKERLTREIEEADAQAKPPKPVVDKGAILRFAERLQDSNGYEVFRGASQKQLKYCLGYATLLTIASPHAVRVGKDEVGRYLTEEEMKDVEKIAQEKGPVVFANYGFRIDPPKVKPSPDGPQPAPTGPELIEKLTGPDPKRVRENLRLIETRMIRSDPILQYICDRYANATPAELAARASAMREKRTRWDAERVRREKAAEAEQRQKDEEDAKAKEAANRPKQARGKLSLAQNLAKSGQIDAAIRTVEALIKEFPETDVAAEAKVILDQWKSGKTPK